MAKNLVIVESPAKAKTIKKFLGSSYQVVASNGHVRDLPKSQMGVDLDHDFEPKYITIRGKGELLSQLKKEVKKADKVYLATDPDREGEAISWHLKYALNLDQIPTQRITFNEITKEAVKGAIKQARDIDMNLVNAQQARRILDRVVGYQISPVLWKKVKKGLSAGRVQSAALKLLCDREDEIADFIQEEFWSIEAQFGKCKAKGHLGAKLTAIDKAKVHIENGKDSASIIERIRGAGDFLVEDMKKGKRSRKAPLPFTTSTLQQEASKRLNFTPQKTMRIAQQLYEGVEVKGAGQVGLITYLRTDSVRIAEEAHNAAVLFIEETYGREYAGEKKEPEKKGRIQDAHEAIRPTYATDYLPAKVEDSLSRDQFRLYKLIWERFMASRMSPAEYETYQVKLVKNEFEFTASGSRIRFPGFLKVYQEQEEEKETYESIEGLEIGDQVQLKKIEGLQHFTQPPARYTEASLVKALEENGVGRPSTYAPTIGILLTRNYIAKEKKSLFVTELGTIVNQIISEYFKDIVDIHFTAQMEESLDHVEEGTEEWKQVLRDFYVDFAPLVEVAMEKLEKVTIQDEVTDVICEKCGRNMVLKYGRFGKFYACPGFPECRNAKPYFEAIDAKCPLCGGQIQMKKTKKGRLYYGCENNPECGFMSWDKPTDQTCPECGSMLYEKVGKKRKLICSKEDCGYVKELPKEEEETDE
ncbi:type I DNA topoisomerase [Bianquea renquensis]|uniref:DNA topoisomerase 1 n=1 Tax=Bianquea renquensis TaxID=2763661 RepID=A0A926I315_9FIRM|nr:type I DNA topoisomerase [Bianquea renquensis]MBC8544880.1 type I DNA topoisomerase [Bianquea renquensis]